MSPASQTTVFTIPPALGVSIATDLIAVAIPRLGAERDPAAAQSQP